MTRTTSDSPASARKPRFVSLRWRFIFPLAIGVMVVAMVGAYTLANNLSGGFVIAEDNVLLQSSQAIAGRAAELYQRQRAEAQRVAFTIGVPEAIRARQSTSLHAMLEGLAATANLDSIIVTDANGIEVAGLLRVKTPDFTDYSVSTDTNLREEPLVKAVIENGKSGLSGLMRTPEGMLLYTVAPIQANNELVGVALVGQHLDTVMTTLRASAVADVTLYSHEGAVVETTFPANNETLDNLRLDRAVLNQVISAQQPVKSSAAVAGTPYRTVYMPFVFGDSVPGVISTAMPNNVPFATEIGRQMMALFASGLAGAAVIVSFTGISLTIARVNKVTATARAIATGKLDSRTGMKAVDEIGRMGAALDAVATVMQKREDKFRTILRRERRERSYLVSILASIPDGVVVQDKDGRVILMNDTARLLLGSPEMFRTAHIREFDAIVSNVLGTALAPGIYSLGDPRQIDHDGKILSAQAAAVLSSSQQRLGTVILVRDITTTVKESQAREQILSQLSQDIQQPLAGLAQQGAMHKSSMVNEFAREISRHAAALQKMIVDMRELTLYNRTTARPMMRPLAVETLLWAVANDWRQIATAANLQLQMMMEKRGLTILGDESRLRLAIGNIVDNAIKYTLPGGTVSIEIKDEVNGTVHLRVRDNGVGISKEDMDSLFMPFYRGTPMTADAQVVRVPGMGQGLPLARQIIEAHGGVIKVKSKPGVGTAVYVALPLTAGAGFNLPLLDDNEDSATIMLPENMDVESVWRK